MDRSVSEYSGYRGRGSLQVVVEELQRQVDSALDFVIDTRELRIRPDENGQPRLHHGSTAAEEFFPAEGYPMLDQAFVQLGGKLPVEGGAPIAFFRKAWAANPQRFSYYLNSIMHDGPARRLVRVLDGWVRAFLSDQYRVIDNLAVARKALEVLMKSGGKVLEASLSDSHMRIKMVSAEVWDSVDRTRVEKPDGWYAGGLGNQEYLSRVAARSWGDMPMHGGPDTVWPIMTLSNSETGHGGFNLSGGILQAICFNLATVEQRMRQVHLGSRLEMGFYKRDTIEAEAEAIYCKIRDHIEAFFTPESFRKIVDSVRKSSEQKIESPSQAINFLIKESPGTLVEADFDTLLAYFVGQPGEQTAYNLGQAVARFAQDVEEPGRADEIETLAGAVLVGKQACTG